MLDFLISPLAKENRQKMVMISNCIGWHCLIDIHYKLFGQKIQEKENRPLRSDFLLENQSF